MHNDVNVRECLETGNLTPIREYLRLHIHQYGATRNMNELLTEITGEGLNVDYYINYMT